VLLTLQDAHGLNVNLILWCVWAGAHFGEPDGATLKSAMAVANEWDAAVAAPLRAVRRKLKNGAAGIADEALRDQVKAAELGAERALQLKLESLAAGLPGAAGDRLACARRTLAAYARAARAAETPGFSISLLEEVIRLTVHSSVEG
jgi:uncharacterized protein (TIGR02444 family)